MLTLLDIFFDHYRWYRSKRGGHWELWRNDVTCSDEWRHMPSGCSRLTGERMPCSFGAPICEDI